MSNDSTTNNYKKLTFPSLMKGYDKIIIPMIQRDYAQGRTDKKAQEVRTNLLNDIFDEEKESIHFDLIFGSCEKKYENGREKQCFIPVDGQQRLTTLFLLYLYAQKSEQHIEGVDLSKFSYDTRRAAADFCKKVTSEEWTIVQKRKVSDIIKDSVWFMNYWENDPTVAGMLNMLDAIHEKAEGRSLPTLEKIQFYFFDLESNGLNENLYLKMNSRGKPLTAFENLKASIEKVLPDNLESDDANNCFPYNSAAPESFKDKWKFFMDRDWTAAFWNSEKAEETDKNITAFIVRFLSGYYNAFNEDGTISEDLKGINSKENYADFIPFKLIDTILNKDDVFSKLAYAFTTIVNVANIKPSWDETITSANLSEYKIIAVIFTYVLFDSDKSAMRFAWNMAENTITGYDNFIAYCKRIREIYNHYGKDKDIYQILANNDFKNPSVQLTEEVEKAKKIIEDSSWENKFIKAEKYAFFKGAIRFLFHDFEGNSRWEYFDIKWEQAQKYFDANGVKDNNVNGIRYKTEALLLKAVLYHAKDFWRLIECRKFVFDNKSDTWKSNILLEQGWEKAVHKIMMNDLSIKERDEDCLMYKNLYNSNLLNYVASQQTNSRIKSIYGHRGLYPPRYEGILLDDDYNNFYRNSILFALLTDHLITSNQKIECCDFFKGWDVNFYYIKDENQFEFQWNTDNHVYLVEEGKWVIRDDKIEEKYDKYYCFDASMIKEKGELRKRLDDLIELVPKN